MGGMSKSQHYAAGVPDVVRVQVENIEVQKLPASRIRLRGIHLWNLDFDVACWLRYSCLRFDRPFPIGYGPNLLFGF